MGFFPLPSPTPKGRGKGGVRGKGCCLTPPSCLPKYDMQQHPFGEEG